MIRSKARQHAPVYREVLKHAILAAWRERKYWPLAFLASVLLTGSFYDVTLRFFQSLAQSSASINTGNLPDFSVTAQALAENPIRYLDATYALQGIITIAVIFLAFISLSCMAQAGLVYALGALRGGKPPTLREAFRVGGAAFWPVAAINALGFSVVWILRFFIAFPLYLAVTTPQQLNVGLYIISFIVFVPLIFLIMIMQIFSVNAMVLQGAPALEAIIRSYNLFKKHWLTIVETAFLLFVITLLISVIATGIMFAAMIPLFVAILFAAMLQSTTLLYTAMGIALALLLVWGFVIAAYSTQLHYATWTYLYRKLGEGGVVPKIHRWARGLMGIFTVPQS